jgi:5-(carboxyamino)imidazole ribonucleotide mutase
MFTFWAIIRADFFYCSCFYPFSGLIFRFFYSIIRIYTLAWRSCSAPACSGIRTISAAEKIISIFIGAATGGNMKKVGVIMGSASDLPVVEKALNTLKSFDVPFEVHVYSAHRTPAQAKAFAQSAYDNGFGVLIAAAGKAAHLAGAIAAATCLPVIGLPIRASNLDGIDALLSTVQMPSGIPVATVAIDGAANAALLSIQILATSDPALYQRLTKQREQAAQAF